MTTQTAASPGFADGFACMMVGLVLMFGCLTGLFARCPLMGAQARFGLPAPG